mgnify:FL=1
MAVKSGYERYSLTGNPFRDLASENIENVDIFHVSQDLDDHIRMIREEVFDEENQAVVAILGGLGAGKTQRLLLTAREAEKHDAMYMIKTVNPRTSDVLLNTLNSIEDKADMSFIEKYVVEPRWTKDIKKAKKIVKSKKKKFDPEFIGTALANAFNANKPSILMLNDFHNLPRNKELEQFIQVLYVFMNHMEDGVMLMFSCVDYYFHKVMKKHESFNERINYKLQIPDLKDHEANLMIAKRLLAKRLVEDLDPVYPFNRDSVTLMNDEVYGNPRQLLKLADRVIEKAATLKALQIDAKFTSDVIEEMKEKRALPPAPEDKERELWKKQQDKESVLVDPTLQKKKKRDKKPKVKPERTPPVTAKMDSSEIKQKPASPYKKKEKELGKDQLVTQKLRDRNTTMNGAVSHPTGGQVAEGSGASDCNEPSGSPAVKKSDTGYKTYVPPGNNNGGTQSNEIHSGEKTEEIPGNESKKGGGESKERGEEEVVSEKGDEEEYDKEADRENLDEWQEEDIPTMKEIRNTLQKELDNYKKNKLKKEKTGGGFKDGKKVSEEDKERSIKDVEKSLEDIKQQIRNIQLPVPPEGPYFDKIIEGERGEEDQFDGINVSSSYQGIPGNEGVSGRED